MAAKKNTKKNPAGGLKVTTKHEGPLVRFAFEGVPGRSVRVKGNAGPFHLGLDKLDSRTIRRHMDAWRVDGKKMSPDQKVSVGLALSEHLRSLGRGEGPWLPKKGDKVSVTLMGLQRHAASTPAGLGYSGSTIEWRRKLGDRKGVIATITRVFPGKVPNVNLEYSDGYAVQVPAYMLRLGRGSKKNPQKFVYEVATTRGTKKFKTRAALLKAYPSRGAYKGSATKVIGQPKLEGLSGPMFNGEKDGVTTIRYEDRGTYKALSNPTKRRSKKRTPVKKKRAGVKKKRKATKKTKKGGVKRRS